MATLATFFKQNGAMAFGAARGNSASEARREAAAVQHDPWALRALPNDEIYFYAKKIDNSRVVRQTDPAARAECWSAVTAAGVVLMLIASIIAPHVGSVLAGYKLEAARQHRQELLNQSRELDVKEAGLLSPERLNGLALSRRLTSPAPDQVIHLDQAVPEGSFARNQAPASGPVPAGR